MDEQRARHMVQAGAVIQEKSGSKNGAALFNAVKVRQSRALLWRWLIDQRRIRRLQDFD
jgi:hypothetical protein